DRLRAMPARRLLAPAGAVATLLVVVGVAITAVGGFRGGGSSSSRVESTSRAAPGSTPTLPSPARGQYQLAAPSRGSGRGGSSDRALSPLAGSARSAPSAGPRRVTHNANLTLSTDPDQVR